MTTNAAPAAIDTAPRDREFADDRALLRTVLDRVILAGEGEQALALHRRAIDLGERLRSGDATAAAELEEMIAALSVEDLGVLARSLTRWFQLLNLAEDNDRIRRLRARELAEAPAPRGGSLRATIEEIAAEAKCSPTRVQDLRDAARTCVSLETPVGDDGGSVLGDLIQDTDGVSAPDLLEQQEFTDGVRSLLDVLPERQVRIMRLRFGLEDGRERTLQEVAQELGLTRERIRQLEKQSLAMLKQSGRPEELFALAS